MPRNGNGSYVLPNPAFTPGSTISSAAVNGDLSDVATALTGSVSADGQTTITGPLKFPTGTAAAPAFTFASDLTTGMYYVGTKKLGFSAGGTAAIFIDQNNVGSGQSGNQLYFANTAILNPVGMVTDFAGPTAPAGWLLCFGQVVNVSSYPELYVALGSTNTYGGNGTTTFGIPDCRGRATYGKDNMGGSTASRITVAGGNFDATVLGGTGGAQNSTLTTGMLPSVSVTPNFTGSPTNLNATVTTSANTGNVTNGTNATVQPVFSVNNTNVTHTPVGTISAVAFGSVSPTPVPTVNPAIIFNKIIFAGRP